MIILQPCTVFILLFVSINEFLWFLLQIVAPVDGDWMDDLAVRPVWLAFWTLTVPWDGSLELKIASTLWDAPLTELPQALLFLSLSFFFILCMSNVILPHGYYLTAVDHMWQSGLLCKTLMIYLFYCSILILNMSNTPVNTEIKKKKQLCLSMLTSFFKKSSHANSASCHCVVTAHCSWKIQVDWWL